MTAEYLVGFDLAHAAGNVELNCMIGMSTLPAGAVINTLTPVPVQLAVYLFMNVIIKILS